MNTLDLQRFADGAQAAAQSGESVLSEPSAAVEPVSEQPEAAEVVQTAEGEARDANSDLPVETECNERLAQGRLRMRDWEMQGEQIKAFYPSFSFHDEYCGNEQFGQLLHAGVPVRQAYEVTHLPQILASCMQYAAKQAAEKTAKALRADSMRPTENGLHDRTASIPGEKGVENLTRADIIRILDRVGKGDKITF